MKNINGFSLSEVIIAMSILMILVASILPIYQLIEREQYKLKHQHLIRLALHDELLDIIWLDRPLTSFEKVIQNRQVNINFKNENGYVKGCASWENVREQTENLCLYGIKYE